MDQNLILFYRQVIVFSKKQKRKALILHTSVWTQLGMVTSKDISSSKKSSFIPYPFFKG